MINFEQNFFKLSNKEFLFRFHEGKFAENFEKKNENIIKIISKDNLNQINIISKAEYEYIFIYDNSNTFYNYYEEEEDKEEYFKKIIGNFERLNFKDSRSVPIHISSYKKYSE